MVRQLSGTFKANSNFLPSDLAVQVLSKTRPWHHLSPLLGSPWVGPPGAMSQQRPRGTRTPRPAPCAAALRVALRNYLPVLLPSKRGVWIR